MYEASLDWLYITHDLWGDLARWQDKKDALGRKTVVHDANTDLVRELYAPSDA